MPGRHPWVLWAFLLNAQREPRFIDGATRLRGMARSLDVAQVLTSIKKVELKIEEGWVPGSGRTTSFQAIAIKIIGSCFFSVFHGFDEFP